MSRHGDSSFMSARTLVVATLPVVSKFSRPFRHEWRPNMVGILRPVACRETDPPTAGGTVPRTLQSGSSLSGSCGNPIPLSTETALSAINVVNMGSVRITTAMNPANRPRSFNEVERDTAPNRMIPGAIRADNLQPQTCSYPALHQEQFHH